MADIGDLVRDDHVVLGINHCLHVVTHDAGAAAAGRHPARIGIGERDLLVRALEQPSFDRTKLAEVVLDPSHLLLQPGDPRWRDRGRFAVGTVQLIQVAPNAFLELLSARL